MNIFVRVRTLVCKFFRSICILVIAYNSFLVAQTDSAINSVMVSLQSQPAIHGVVHIFEENNFRYLAVEDVATALSFFSTTNKNLRKTELTLWSVDGNVVDTTRIKFTAESPFIISTLHRTRTQKVIQLAHPVKWWKNTAFLLEKDIVSLIASATRLQVLVSDSVIQAAPAKLSYNITGVDVEEKNNGSLLRIHSIEKLHDVERFQQENEWLYLTIPGGRADTVALAKKFPSGIIKKIVPIQSATSLQLSFQLRNKIGASEIMEDQGSSDILVSLHIAEENITPPPKRVEKKHNDDFLAQIEKQKKKWKLDVVVIDAGHGGHDPGAIGVIGTREKDVALGIALKLGSMIEKHLSDVKVVYTRKTDRFIELYRRGQIANEAEGKLFVSIHCNSSERKPSSNNGFEIYLLRPGKTEAALHIAEKENAVVKLEKDFEDRYQELTEENYIILTMAQSAYVKQSERFAEMLEEQMEDKLVSQSRGVKQAGFFVLVGASMPNVLVETGYLSNIKDEKFLRSPGGQYVVAESIFNGIKKFKGEYERKLRE